MKKRDTAERALDTGDDVAAQEARLRALAAASVLGASLAHELRNTLASAESALFLARRDVSDGARLARHLDHAEEGIRRSQEVVDRVLGLARGEPLRREPAALLPICEAALREVVSSPAPSIALSVTPPDLEAPCDPILIERVLVNLLVNAAEALSARSSGHVMLRATRDADAVVIEVEDDGPGIDPALLPRIFEPLVTDKPTGTGLGLAFCRTIALVHGGTIDAFCAPSGGALFRLVLPAA